MNGLLARKSVADFEADVAEHGGLKRSLGKWHLTALGVGATIGAGIFATTGTAIVGDSLRPGAGPGHHLLVLAYGRRLRVRGALLRRVRRHGSGGRLGVHVRVCVDRRVRGLDHRLGPDHRVRRRQHRGRHRLVRVLPRTRRPLRAQPPRVVGHRLPLGARRVQPALVGGLGGRRCHDAVPGLGVDRGPARVRNSGDHQSTGGRSWWR